MQVDTHSRSFIKAVTYRVFGSLTTAGIVFFYNGSAKVAVGAGALDAVSKIVLYFLHERAWSYVPYGRPKTPEYEI
jgi:uncharacterized membrane protein